MTTPRLDAAAAALALLALGVCTESLAADTTAVRGTFVAPICSDGSSQCLDATARIYIGALVSHDGSTVPLTPTVVRTENALVNAKGEYELRESFTHTGMVRGARDIRFIVDEKNQELVAFYLLDIVLKDNPGTDTKAGGSSYRNAVTVPAGNYTVHEAERFKFEHGLIAEVEVLGHVETELSGVSGWPK